MVSSFSDQLKRLEKEMGYKGCKNCQHQIEPLRMCKWAEQGGDGRIHLICPKWDKKGGKNELHP